MIYRRFLGVDWYLGCYREILWLLPFYAVPFWLFQKRGYWCGLSLILVEAECISLTKVQQKKVVYLILHMILKTFCFTNSLGLTKSI